MICSSDGFTNILILRIYKIKCCYSHPQYIRINKQTQFHEKKTRRFVVSKFVKLSDELINNLHNTLIALQRSTKFWIGYVILLNKIFVLQNPCVHFSENKVGKKGNQ